MRIGVSFWSSVLCFQFSVGEERTGLGPALGRLLARSVLRPCAERKRRTVMKRAVAQSMPTLLQRQFAVGAVYFGEEGAKFGGIFFAGARFDAGGYVDGAWANGDDGFADDFGIEAAGEDG